MDVRKLERWEDVAPKIDAARKCATATWNSDKVAVMSSMDMITFSPNLAPLAIFPFDDRVCIELAIGTKSFTTYLNASRVLRDFEAAGWSIESSLDDAIAKTDGDAVAIIKKGAFFCHIPPGDFGKLQFELLNPSTLIEECEYIRGLDPKVAEGYGIWTFEGEASQWD